MIVMVALALLYAVNMPLTYTAAATALLSPAPGNPLTAEAASGGAIQMNVALETEAQLVRTPEVAELVTKRLGRTTPGAGERFSVSVPSNTQMLEISFTASSPERAQENAQAYAEGYLEYRAERARSVQEARIERLREQVAETDANLRRALSEASAADTAAYASQEVQLFADRLAQLSNSLSAEEAVSTTPGSVISAAVLPESSNQLPTWILVAAGAILGLIVGLLLALLREWRHDLLRDAEMGEGLGVPVLANVRSTSGEDLASVLGADLHESYRQMRTSVIAAGERPHILAVTALDSDRGAEVSVNLAIVLAEARFSVLLICADPNTRDIERLLDIDSGSGLAEAVLEKAPARELLVQTHGISLMRSGVDPRESRDLTASSTFREVVEQLHYEFDYVILSAAPAGSAEGDAALLAADSALIVLAPDATTRALLEASLDRFGRLGVKTLGVVNVLRSRRRARKRGSKSQAKPTANRASRSARGDSESTDDKRAFAHATD